MSRFTPRIRIVAAVVVTAALSIGVMSVMTAGATTPNATYYACLAKGKLSKVGTTSPTCSSKASVISWNSVGPPGPQTGALLYENTQYFTGPYGGEQTVATFNVPAGLMCIQGTATAYTTETPPQEVEISFAPISTGPPDISLALLANEANDHESLVPVGGSGCVAVQAGTVKYVGVGNASTTSDGNDSGSISVMVYSQ
jgi:hypothetical protein